MNRSSPAEPSRLHWPSALQLAYNLLAIAALWLLSLGLLGYTLVTVNWAALVQDPLPLITAAEFGLLGVLLIPSGWNALQRLRGNAAGITPVAWLQVRRLIWMFPFVWFLGFGLSAAPALFGLFMPPVHMLGIGLPLLWFISLGGWGVPLSRQRAWGIFGVGLTLGPLVILLLELVVGAAAAGLVVVIASREPGFWNALSGLMATAQETMPTTQELFSFAEQYLLQSDIIVIALLFIAVIVPILEEAFKTIGVWALLPRGVSPAVGFLGGMISGAGFAFFESLSLGSQGTEWGMLVGVRMGTSLVHVVTAGLTGWGLAIAWQKDSAWRGLSSLLARFLLAVIIHGTWNGLTALVVLGEFTNAEFPLSSLPWAAISGIGLPTIAGTCFLILLTLNQRFRRQAPARTIAAALSPQPPAAAAILAENPTVQTPGDVIGEKAAFSPTDPGSESQSDN